MSLFPPSVLVVVYMCVYSCAFLHFGTAHVSHCVMAVQLCTVLGTLLKSPNAPGLSLALGMSASSPHLTSLLISSICCLWSIFPNSLNTFSSQNPFHTAQAATGFLCPPLPYLSDSLCSAAFSLFICHFCPSHWPLHSVRGGNWATFLVPTNSAP